MLISTTVSPLKSYQVQSSVCISLGKRLHLVAGKKGQALHATQIEQEAFELFSRLDMSEDVESPKMSWQFHTNACGVLEQSLPRLACRQGAGTGLPPKRSNA